MSLTFIFELCFYAFTLWLGAYLLARGSRQPAVYLTGWGLLAYALVLAVQLIFDRLIPALVLIPPLLWVGAAIHLLPEDFRPREILLRIWIIGALPLVILTLLQPWFGILILLELLACAGLLVLLARRAGPERIYLLLAVIALFIALSTGLLVLPLGWIPPAWGLTLLGLDMLSLGLAVTVWDAFDQSQAIRAPLLRSFVSAFYYAGALAAIGLLAGTSSATSSQNPPAGPTFLLLALVGFGILTQTFSDRIQSLLDNMVYTQDIHAQRELLRSTAEALPRLSSLAPLSDDDEEFARLTRRALSQLGDLPKLAASPLTLLPALAHSGPNPLDRARALKTALTESILRLKPQTAAAFGATDEWRYYNALYFPYVAGLKLYTRLPDHTNLDEASRQALDWFQSSVPERTLRNWQNSAARLVAADLKSRLGL